MKQLEIQEILESSLQQKIKQIRHSRSEYESSFELENLDITLEDDRIIQMVFKNVGPDAILPIACDSKQELFFDPQRELDMYRSVLNPQNHGTPICYDCEIDRLNNRYWLFLERVDGLKLSFIGEFKVWLDSVRWLAQFHAGFASHAKDLRHKVNAIEYDRNYFRRWCNRAIDFLARSSLASFPAIRLLGDRYDRVIDRLISMPITLCHGDCYPSNILVRNEKSLHAVCVVDWELTAVGPGLIDLASLTAGKWSADERSQFVKTYWDVMTAFRHVWPTPDHLNADLNWCRLHLAVQWLGWSPKWAPPIDQANDWLEEMNTLAGQLNLL